MLGWVETIVGLSAAARTGQLGRGGGGAEDGQIFQLVYFEILALCTSDSLPLRDFVSSVLPIIGKILFLALISFLILFLQLVFGLYHDCGLVEGII